MHQSIIQLFNVVKEIDKLAMENPAVFMFLEQNQLLASINEIVMAGNEREINEKNFCSYYFFSNKGFAQNDMKE
ncbi:hypothetical protein [Niallia sp. 01092]|uniref:hypothetical protein n=1 Tax=unclassified Niallia TaxID=2837522 RepID=UPI003FD47B2E